MPTLTHQNIANGTTVPSAETILATTPVNNINPATATKVVLRGTVNLVAGTGTTAIVLKIYRGAAISGPNLLATLTLTLAAAANGSLPFSIEDTVAWLASPANGGQYCISLTQTGGTANGTINLGDLQVEVLP